MIDDDFYATLKLKSGEEIFCKIAPTEEENEIMLLVSNPVIVQEVRGRVGILGYKTKNFHLSNGMSQSTFYSMKEGGISDTSLKEFLIMEDRFLELEKLSVCSGMSRKYESFELS